MIKVERLGVRVKGFSLSDISFEAETGEFFVILGPTGAGKTMLLRAIAGLERVCAGQVLIDGADATHAPPERRDIGFMFQENTLFPHLSVRDNIAYGLKRRGKSKQDIAGRCREIAGLLGIEHLLDRKPGKLSGGEAQRVGLARTLAPDPGLLLLDEPLLSIDPSAREALQQELRGIHERLKKTVIFVTHSFEEAAALAGRIGVMRSGRLVQVGTPGEIFRRPESEFVARFSLARNIFKVDIEDEAKGLAAASIDGTKILTTTSLRGPRHMSLRPEDIIVSRERISSSALNSLEGKVRKIEDKGSLVHLTVSVPPDLVALITARSLRDLGLEEGMHVFVTFKASAVWVF
ncbi:MAG: ABC transporter ATP-binding protein [Pseudomonadota bacterium]